MTRANIQAHLKKCDDIWAVLGKERVKAIAEKCGAGDKRRRKITLELFVPSTLIAANSKKAHGFFSEIAATAHGLSQDTDNPLEPATKQAVGKQMQRRDMRLFAGIFGNILKSSLHLLTEQDKWCLKKFKDARVVDSTVINLNKVLCDVFCAAAKGKAALKIHTVFSLSKFVPLKLEITKQRSSDVKFDFLDGTGNVLYIDDLGYWCFPLFRRIMGQGSFFISRLKSGCDPRIEEFLCPGYSPWEGHRPRLRELNLGGDTFDALIRLRGIAEKLRLVGLKHKGEWYFYVTNIMDKDFTPQVVYEIYRMRWQIELFFKWLKHILKLEHITCETPNAIMIEIYAAMIMFLITRLLMEKASRAYGVKIERFSMEKCLRIVGVNFGVVVLCIMEDRPPPDHLIRLLASPLGLKGKPKRRSAKGPFLGLKPRRFSDEPSRIFRGCLCKTSLSLTFRQNYFGLS
jgi:hypothetical protein